MSFFWSDAEKQRVAELLLAGLSASKIATQMQCSRNAVIGVVSRDPVLKKIGLSGRANRPKPEPQSCQPRGPRVSPSLHLRAARRAPAKPRPPVHVDPVAPVPLDIALHELRHDQCKWPTNDPPKGDAFTFCGHVRTGPAYCAYHSHRAVRHDH